jgi:hypothetical protein
MGNTEGRRFLERLGPEGFPVRFSRISNRLGLGAALCEEELKMLYHAAYTATLCHIAFNGFGGCAGEIKPERELNRIALEQGLMHAQNRLKVSGGWRGLPASMKETVERIFLRVFGEDENLCG